MKGAPKISNDILKCLKASGALLEDTHLVLTSGKHSDAYVNLRAIAGNTDALTLITNEILDQLLDHHDQIDPKGEIFASESLCIVGPETIGRCLAQSAADAILDANYAWCKPNADHTAQEWDPKLPFADTVKGKYCYIVDDVLTSAKTLIQTIDLLKQSDCKILGAIVVIDRSAGITAQSLGIPWLQALVRLDLTTYEPDDCPLCKRRRPMRLRPGHGHEWIKDHPDYPTLE